MEHKRVLWLDREHKWMEQMEALLQKNDFQTGGLLERGG